MTFHSSYFDDDSTDERPQCRPKTIPLTDVGKCRLLVCIKLAGELGTKF